MNRGKCGRDPQTNLSPNPVRRAAHFGDPSILAPDLGSDYMTRFVSSVEEADRFVKRAERRMGGGIAADLLDDVDVLVCSYRTEWGEWRNYEDSESVPDAKIRMVEIFTLPQRALTLWQPWAYAITHLGKRIENRTWPAPDNVLGKRIAIHAGARLETDSTMALAYECGCTIDRANLPRKAVVATARVVSVTTQIEHVAPEQRYWWTGPYGWVLDDVRVLATPVPCRGHQKLWRLPPDVAAQVLGLFPADRYGRSTARKGN